MDVGLLLSGNRSSLVVHMGVRLHQRRERMDVNCKRGIRDVVLLPSREALFNDIHRIATACSKLEMPTERILRTLEPF